MEQEESDEDEFTMDKSKMKIKSKAYQEQEAKTNQFLKYDRQVCAAARAPVARGDGHD